jgi:hypothetical protein
LFTGEWVERRTVERSYKEMQNEEV